MWQAVGLQQDYRIIFVMEKMAGILGQLVNVSVPARPGHVNVKFRCGSMASMAKPARKLRNPFLKIRHYHGGDRSASIEKCRQLEY